MRSRQSEPTTTTQQPKPRSRTGRPGRLGRRRRREDPRGQAADALLALQRGRGNHYVQRLLDGGSGGSALDDRTRSRLERAFGTDMSSVTVEHRPDVAALGALAYTRGEHIGVAPAQRLDTADGQELLAHEVAHVVQQRQGRVHPQVRLGGVGFSTDRRLETEADAIARRVAGGGPAGIRAPERPATGGVAQGKFGFEFETVNNFVAHDDRPMIREKEVAYEDKTNGFRIEGDEGSDAQHTHIEFVTDAFDDPDQAIASAAAAAAVATGIGTRAGQIEGNVMTAGPGAFRTGSWRRKLAMEINDRRFRATMQASVGVRFADIVALLKSNLGGDELGQLAATTKGVWLAAGLPTTGISHSLWGFITLLGFYIRRTGRPNERRDAPGDNTRHWVQVPGDDWQMIPTDGPKAKFTVMARTDFHSMFLALSETDQEAFRELVRDPRHSAQGSELAKALGRQSLLEKVFVDPYRADSRLHFSQSDKTRLGMVTGTENVTGNDVLLVTNAPSILEWLVSIVSGNSYYSGQKYISGRDASKKDMLSSPPGYGTVSADVGFRPSAEQILANSVYGMGAYRMDKEQNRDPLAVFELRGISRGLVADKFDLSASQWEAQVRHSLKTYLSAGVGR